MEVLMKKMEKIIRIYPEIIYIPPAILIAIFAKWPEAILH